MPLSENYLVVIPARGGSKGIPGKNSKPLFGKPLIHYTIEVAAELFHLERIFVSTDDVKIQELSKELGLNVPQLRPAHLATDTASSREVLLDILEQKKQQGEKIDTLILLQPTSPFRIAEDIVQAVQLYDENLDMVVSVKETKTNPYFNLFEENIEGFLEKSKTGNFTSRQEVPVAYEFNGAVYIINTKSLIDKEIGSFKKIKKYIMPKERSIDLDEPLDWDIAEMMLEKGYFERTKK